MDCFPDFCLGCDNTAVDGLYCSENCRMEDLSKSGSAPVSPAHTTSTLDTHHSHFHFTTSSFVEPPSEYPPPPPTKFSSSVSLEARASTTLYKHGRPSGTRSAYSSPQRILSPSASRSSLQSNGRSSMSDVMSEAAAKELLGYFSAFDRTRDQRRRSLPPNTQAWTNFSAIRESRRGH